MVAAEAALPAGLAAQRHILASFGFGKPALDSALHAAMRNGTDVVDELVASGTVREELYYEAVAKMLSVRFLSVIAPQDVCVTPSLDILLRHPWKPLRVDGPDGLPLTVIAPRGDDLERLVLLLERQLQLRTTFAIAPPRAISEAVWAARALERTNETVRQLFEERPRHCARIVASGRQGFLFGALFASLAFSLAAFWTETWRLLHLTLTTLFAACVFLRAFAGVKLRHRPARLTVTAESPGLPCYTVMVAMYDEAAVVGQLVTALNDLSWPRSRLDIKLVVEANDAATISALGELDLGPEYEIVRVPRIEPFTKPKALTYALAGARGDFTVIYDAEDRPHPDQLLEAYSRFLDEGPELACIQAPLIIANARRSWLTGLFAMEYCALFRGLLPFLARAGMPIPLGGTSNHIRTGILRAIGGWDPFNVTEDADLGLRLARAGYRLDVISRPTLEDAPTGWGVWLLQRSRWFKGWAQTWLVTMRHPVQAILELGVPGFMAVQIMTLGMLISALFSPWMVFFVTSGLIRLFVELPEARSSADHFLLALDIAVLAGTYIAFVLLAYRSMTMTERLQTAGYWMYLPVYWMLMCFAAWHALYQLAVRPHHWAKTPHLPVVGPTAAMAEARPAQEA